MKIYDLSRASPIPAHEQCIDTTDLAERIASAMSRYVAEENVVTKDFNGDLAAINRQLSPDVSVVDNDLLGVLGVGAGLDAEPKRNLQEALDRFVTTAPFQRLYRHLVHRVCMEVLRVDCAYQLHPTIRCIVPNTGMLDMLRLPDGTLVTHHSDILYGDPCGQINCWLPLTPARGGETMSIMPLETSLPILRKFFGPGDPEPKIDSGTRHRFFEFIANDRDVLTTLLTQSAPLEIAPGTTRLFDVRQVHATGDNKGERTRVSLDFRLVPAPIADWLDASDNDNLSFLGAPLKRGGYYAKHDASQIRVGEAISA